MSKSETTETKQHHPAVAAFILNYLVKGDTRPYLMEMFSEEALKEASQRASVHLFADIMKATDARDMIASIMHASPCGGWIKQHLLTKDLWDSLAEFLSDDGDQVIGVLFDAIEKDGGKSAKELRRVWDV